MATFEGKSAIVTGAASGIGRALAEALARRGAAVTLADVDADGVSRAAGELSVTGRRATGAVLDVTDPAAVQAVVDGVLRRHGHLDYLFNNAGVATMGEARDATVADWSRVIDVNLRGVVHGVQAAYPVMVEQGAGHIVNVASLAGLVPAPALASYAAAKHGVVGLSTSLRLEGAALGVRVSVVCPGYVQTAIFERMPILRRERMALSREQLLARLPVAPLPVDRCARRILRGVEANRAIIPVTAMAWLGWWAQRLSPTLVDAILLRVYREERRLLRPA